MAKGDKSNTLIGVEKDEPAKKSPALVAKKDFDLCFPSSDPAKNYFREIKVGDDLADVPEFLLENLKTEGVL